MKKIAAHIVGILCIVLCVTFWWYVIYAPIYKSYKASISDASFVDENQEEFTSPRSLVPVLLESAEKAELVIIGCFSDESSTLVSLQVQAKNSFDVLHFFSLLSDQSPYIQCTEISFKKTDILTVDFRFTIQRQLINDPVITPDLLKTDPFCTNDCRTIAHGCCSDLGFTFEVKKRGDTVFIERVYK